MRVRAIAARHERQFRLDEPERTPLLWAVAMVHRCAVRSRLQGDRPQDLCRRRYKQRESLSNIGRWQASYGVSRRSLAQPGASPKTEMTAP
jgi:hypothetical protein